MVVSPRCATSCHTRGITEEQIAMTLTKFLDEWHYCMVDSCLSKDWDRMKALRLAVDLLECNGAAFPDDRFKEELLTMEEGPMVAKIVETLPVDMWETLDEILAELMAALETSTRIRGSLDRVAGTRPAAEVIEETLETSTTKYLLRSSVRAAGKQVVKTRKCQHSWMQATEERIDRLMRSAEDADKAMRDLLIVESTLAELGGTQRSRSKAFLSAFVSGQSESSKAMVFAGWNLAVMKAKNESNVRSKIMKKLEEAEKKLYDMKQSILGNVRRTLQRQLQAEDVFLTQTSMAAWVTAVADAKREKEEERQIEEARDKLGALRVEQTAKSRKVLLAMGCERPEMILAGAIACWTQYVEDSKKEKENELRLTEAEAAMKARLDAQKGDTIAMMQKMLNNIQAVLMESAFEGWTEVVKEEAQYKKMGDKISELETSFKSATLRQCGNAMAVQCRVNGLMVANYLQVLFANWNLVVKCESIEHQFNRKIDSKRRQLQGVQSLFRSFAKQLDAGLGDGDSASDRESRPMRKSAGKGDPRSGLVKCGDGSVSLPDIHQSRQAWA